MSSPVKPQVILTDDQFSALLTERAKGGTTRSLAAWLSQTYDVNVSHAWVGKVLRENQQERSEAIREKVVEALEPHVVSDLELLGARRKQVGDLADRLLAANDVGPYLKAAELEMKILDKRLHYAGADQPDNATADAIAAAASELDSGLARLAARRAASG